jgi:hypothetical protein
MKSHLSISISLSIIMIAMMGLSACKSTKTGMGSNDSLPFSVAKNYFFNNDQSIPSNPKIDSQALFDKYFGAAAFMGKDGEPTRIDFKKQFVIAVVMPVTSYETELSPVRLSSDNDEMTFRYKVVKGKKQSYETQPLMLIVVDKRYEKGKVTIQEE